MENFKMFLKAMALILIILFAVAACIIQYGGNTQVAIYYLVNAILLKLFLDEEK